MCGIAGIIHSSRDTVAAAIRRMTAAEAHRGPDDEGIHECGGGSRAVGLGHRRLSIIDVSPLGHQPMLHPQTGDALIFNGEIYNFAALRDELISQGVTFRGHSDSEVLLMGLTLHGPSYIERLEGMFAFAFLDKRGGQLYLARDPLGIKPLYFAATSDLLVFASEVRCVLSSGVVSNESDSAAIGTFLAFGAVSEPRTIFKSVRMLEPGTVATVDLSSESLAAGMKPRRYWSYPNPSDGVDSEKLREGIVSTLDGAVASHLVSDVPVGVFLSSGIDSTIVAWLASRHTSKLRTFTVGFSDQQEMSELEAARATASEIGSTHKEIVLCSDDARDAVADWITSMDQPSIDGLNTYLISRSVRQEGVVVALSGLGGDELFCGYRTFSDVPRGYQLIRRLGWIPSRVRSAMASTATAGKSLRVRRKAADIAACSGALAAHYLLRRRIASSVELSNLGVDVGAVDREQAQICEASLGDSDLQASDPIASISRYECTHYMRNTLLRDSDVNGMAHGLEIRVPMLDRRVVELAHGIPGTKRMPSGRADKTLLRECFPGALRSRLLALPKRGFTLPIGHWMKGQMRDACDAAIASASECAILDGGAVRRLWKDFIDAPESDRWSQAFSLCILGWHLERASRSFNGVSA
ncbi:MAG: asparagine synthase (glutamine-hydrolyzing) [Phycisphaerales bacterium]|nr:asparagine synthase (glutamine-hydrolyzing) [Phycisphaerales bacterium]MCB9854177.1 asparagine synthase (glutamine-hydrolyzing) [Phycisphaerales bacterium]MCB9864687.1 asparagine synthase (glutamine-hydrolyzing) [Phycisphaerales bacterium]